MAWTNRQKSNAVIACRKLKINEDQRKMILSRLPNALVNGDYTSTSRKLNQTDYDYFMSVIESFAPDNTIPSYSRGYWQNALDDKFKRMRIKVKWFAKQLEEAKILTCPIEVILRRHTGNEVQSLDEVEDYNDMAKLINALRAKAQKHGFKLKE